MLGRRLRAVTGQVKRARCACGRLSRADGAAPVAKRVRMAWRVSPDRSEARQRRDAAGPVTSGNAPPVVAMSGTPQAMASILREAMYSDARLRSRSGVEIDDRLVAHPRESGPRLKPKRSRGQGSLPSSEADYHEMGVLAAPCGPSVASQVGQPPSSGTSELAVVMIPARHPLCPGMAGRPAAPPPSTLPGRRHALGATPSWSQCRVADRSSETVRSAGPVCDPCCIPRPVPAPERQPPLPPLGLRRSARRSTVMDGGSSRAPASRRASCRRSRAKGLISWTRSNPRAASKKAGRALKLNVSVLGKAALHINVRTREDRPRR